MTMYTTWASASPDKPRRTARTKNGCLTCRRRKVRCNEARPRCGHCTRLQLDCTWNTPSTTHVNTPETRQREQITSPAYQEPFTMPNQDLQPTDMPVNDLAFNELFNYASFMWDDNMSAIGNASNLSPTQWSNIEPISLQGTLSSNRHAAAYMAQHSNQRPHMDAVAGLNNVNPSTTSGSVAVRTLTPTSAPDDNQLTEYFVRSDAPPILAPVETRFRWSSMKKIFSQMSSRSRMVRYAVLAFSAVQLEPGSNVKENYIPYYENSKKELSGLMLKAANDSKLFASELPHVLAVLFLLSYVDLVTDRVTYAHSNLREAYIVFRKVDHGSLNVCEKRLISWIRLLDARAVSAGGDGLFLADEDDSVIAMDLSSPHGSLEAEEDDVEDILSDLLSKPAYSFFQKVQSFMGRISKIDQWHRRRGTVSDETEVMTIAAQISRDITALYQDRPALMDQAVAGRLSEPHLSPNLAVTMTRSLRTYLANYHASFIHLHRVAYRGLPRTDDVINAMITIKQMARLMSEASGSEESLPVNMLWPLLMWGCEEDDPDERRWIISLIRKMQAAASNAKITADVLEEVQRRQDDTKSRVDVRTVMHDIFNSCFAIV